MYFGYVLGHIAYTQRMRCGLLLQMSHVAWSVCPCVGTWVSYAKTFEPIEMPFGGWLMLVPGTMYYMGVKIGRIHSQPRCGLLPNYF